MSGKILYLGKHCTWENIIPRKTLYLGKHCTWENIIPRKTLYLGKYCTWENIIPRKTLYLGKYCTWKNIVKVKGRPQTGWMDGVKRVLDEIGMCVEQGRMIVCDRSEWRAVVNV